MNNLYELFYMSRTGDEFARKTLFRFYRGIAAYIVAGMKVNQPELSLLDEDIIQEAVIAMMNAQDQYREDRNASPYTFSVVVIRRRIINVIRHYNTHELALARSSVSLDGIMETQGLYMPAMYNENTLDNPVYYADFYAAIRRLRSYIASLPPADRRILQYWTSGISYAEAARKAGITLKAYDGRLGRMKKKIRQVILQEEMH